MEERLKKLISESLVKLGLGVDDILLEHPADFQNGDFSTNIAMVLAKKVVNPPAGGPQGFAQAIIENMEKDEYVEKVELAGPGFINFYLNRRYFSEEIGKILEQKETYGKSVVYQGKEILVEHSSPNLFKPFHVGHVMNNTIGESITRLARFSGAHVTALSYPSDVSLGIGKALGIALEDGDAVLDGLASEKEKLDYLGECYVRGTKKYDENEVFQTKAKAITKELYEKTPGIILELYEKCKEINIAYFKNITARLGSHFDDFIFESEAGVEGSKIVRENIGKVFLESEGAVIFKGEDRGLHTRVFVNKEGYPTYEAKDIGLLSLKFTRFSPHISILITDNEQAPYYKVVLEAAGEIQSQWKERSVHRTHGRMSFKGQKMSSRLGGVPLAATLLDAVVDEVKEKAPDVDERTANQVAIASLKYCILRSRAGSNINFDPDTSLSFEGESGPYLQYCAVRAKSILEKAKGLGMQADSRMEKGVTNNIEKLLAQFPSVVEQALSEWAPHYVTTYLLSLAQEFNSWYGNMKIVDQENPDSGYNIAITESVSNVLRNGLALLGMEAPEKM